MPTYYKLKLASTMLYYMKTTATNKNTEQEEQISLKSTLDESNEYVSNAITQGEDGNDFQYELENATEIPKSEVPEEVIENFEERIKKFENQYISISISTDSPDDDSI